MGSIQAIKHATDNFCEILFIYESSMIDLFILSAPKPPKSLWTKSRCKAQPILTKYRQAKTGSGTF